MNGKVFTSNGRHRRSTKLFLLTDRLTSEQKSAAYCVFITIVSIRHFQTKVKALKYAMNLINFMFFCAFWNYYHFSG